MLGYGGSLLKKQFTPCQCSTWLLSHTHFPSVGWVWLQTEIYDSDMNHLISLFLEVEDLQTKRNDVLGERWFCWIHIDCGSVSGSSVRTQQMEIKPQMKAASSGGDVVSLRKAAPSRSRKHPVFHWIWSLGVCALLCGDIRGRADRGADGKCIVCVTSSVWERSAEQLTPEPPRWQIAWQVSGQVCPPDGLWGLKCNQTGASYQTCCDRKEVFIQGVSACSCLWHWTFSCVRIVFHDLFSVRRTLRATWAKSTWTESRL